ncbi:hypothetical protein IMZ48_48410 [Candidatus Bathyarchaeota archaeon]|nr:hypothetical protein [Candidatus Bathyarchaeota archaeon]
MSSTARVSSALKSRVHRASMLKKVCNPEDMLPHFPNGTYMGWSGFTGVGYPKYDPLPSSLPRQSPPPPQHG